MDPIANMFSIIKNAAVSKKEALTLPYSRINFEIANSLQKSGFLKEVAKKGRGAKKIISISILYDERGSGKIQGLKKISKLSRRVYGGFRDFLKNRKGNRALIVSTSKGIMSDKEARNLKLGGEIIGEVW